MTVAARSSSRRLLSCCCVFLLALVPCSVVFGAPSASTICDDAEPRSAPLSPFPVHAVDVPSITLLEFWNLIAAENQSVVLGVQVSPTASSGAGRILARAAAVHAHHHHRRRRHRQSDRNESSTHSSGTPPPPPPPVLFRVTSQLPPFLTHSPAIIMFTRAPPDHSCLVKPNVRTYSKTLELCVRAFADLRTCVRARPL